MASKSDEVIYHAPGLRIYTEHGCLIADFNRHAESEQDEI